MSTLVTPSKAQSKSYDILDNFHDPVSIDSKKELKEKLIKELGFVDENGFQNPSSKCLLLESFNDPEVSVDRQGRVSVYLVYPEFIHIELSTTKELFEDPRPNQRGGLRFRMFYKDPTASLQRIFENIEYLANSIRA